MYRASASRDEPPSATHPTDVDTRPLDLGGDHVGRNLQGDITGKKDSNGGLVLYGGQSQVGIDAIQLCGSYVLAI